MCEFFSGMHWWDLLSLIIGIYGLMRAICFERKKDFAVKKLREVVNHTEGLMHGLKPAIQNMQGVITTPQQVDNWLAQIHDTMTRCTNVRKEADNL